MVIVSLCIVEMVSDGSNKIGEYMTNACADGTFELDFSIDDAAAEDVTFVLLAEDIAGNRGLTPRRFNLNMDEFWREADHLWFGTFSGRNDIVDCGCPDCLTPCGGNPGGSDDCLTCSGYSLSAYTPGGQMCQRRK